MGEWLRSVMEGIKNGFSGPDGRLLRLISELRLMQAELQLASTMEPFEGLERFVETLSPWQEKKELVKLIDSFESMSCPKKDAVVTELLRIQAQVREAIRAGAVARLMNRNKVKQEKEGLPRQIKILIRRQSVAIAATVDNLHNLANELLEE